MRSAKRHGLDLVVGDVDRRGRRARWCRRLISVRICTRSLASRLDSGSSNRKTLGRATMARPMATRWRWPPDSWRGLRSRRATMPQHRAASSTRASISAFGPRDRAGRRRCSRRRSYAGRARRTGTPWRCRGPWARSSLTSRRRCAICRRSMSSSPAIIRSMRGLAAARGADQHQELAVGDVEVDAVHDGMRAEQLRHCLRLNHSPSPQIFAGRAGLFRPAPLPQCRGPITCACAGGATGFLCRLGRRRFARSRRASAGPWKPTPSPRQQPG